MTTSTSISQGFHHGILSFSDGFAHRPVSQEQQQQQHVVQQGHHDKLSVHGFHSTPVHQHPLVGKAVAEPGSDMLSDMFNFAPPGRTATDLLAAQISGGDSYKLPPEQPDGIAGFPGEWRGVNPQGMLIGGTSNLCSISSESTSKNHLHGSQLQHPITGLNAESAAVMQLFMINPPSRAPPPAALNPQFSIQSFGEAPFARGTVEGHGLSLSLSSCQQPFQVAEAEELSVRKEVLDFNSQQQEQQQIHINYGATGAVNFLRNSKYLRAAQELLEEFCSVGRGHMKGTKRAKRCSSNTDPSVCSAGGGGAAASSASKDVNPLLPAERSEHERKKTKLISMLDEVDRRFNHYCDQIQMVVNFFNSVLGFGAAKPYTSLAQKAMSRHFRCLKDAITAQLNQTYELLGDKEGVGSSGLTKGETPRLRLLDQTLRQRAFHQMGMMEQEAWRPQRGLPESSVNILRAWLFEHFLHPYPSDADKHLLARQAGLSRNQVSNWFINARVRLWKPMVEDMYQQEFKNEEVGEKNEEESHQTSHSPTQQQLQQQLQQKDRRPQLNNAPSETEPSPSSSSISRHYHRLAFTSDNTTPLGHRTRHGGDSLFTGAADSLSSHPIADGMYQYEAAAAVAALGPAARMRIGTASRDVSLTLGLPHGTGSNAPESGRSSSPKDFGG